MSKRSDALPLFLCFALALGCRVFRRSSELLSSDAADLASDVSSLLCSGSSTLAQLKALVLFRLGGVQPLMVFLHGWIARTLDIPLEPTSWEWSTILVSCASSPLAFLVGRKFGGVVSGWAWAVFLAVSPIHVMLGRNLGAPWAYEINFQLAILWLAERHLGSVSRSPGAALGCVLAGYFWCGNQMLGILPVLAFAIVAHAYGQPKAERVDFVRRKLLVPWVVIAPLTSFAVLAYCTFILHKGHLYHALFQKQKALGWYWDNFYTDLVRNLGYVPAWTTLCALLCALFAPLPLLDRRRIPLAYALSYVLPFVFLVSRSTTLTRGYCVYGITGLLGLVALVPSNLQAIRRRFGPEHDPRIWQVGQAVLLALNALMLVAAAGASVYKLYGSQPFLGVKGFQGSFGRPIGAAAAAGFISRVADNKNGPSGKVFSDAYGGSGLEPPIMRLYFKRPSFVHYDAPRMAPWKAFAPRAAQVGFAVIKPENASLVDSHFPGLKLAARISREGKDDPILLVYVRDYEQPPVALSAEGGRRDYAASFAHFCAN